MHVIMPMQYVAKIEIEPFPPSGPPNFQNVVSPMAIVLLFDCSWSGHDAFRTLTTAVYLVRVNSCFLSISYRLICPMLGTPLAISFLSISIPMQLQLSPLP